MYVSGRDKHMTWSTTTESKPTIPFPASEYAGRIKRLLRLMEKRGLDSFVITTEINRLYFTGFQSSAGMLVITKDEEPVFFTDFRYLETARNRIGVARVRQPRTKPCSPFHQISLLARRGRWKKTGYEGVIASTAFRDLSAALPDGNSLEESIGIIRDLRSIKSRREQAVIRRAAQLTDMLFSKVIEDTSVGMSEWEVRSIIRSWSDRLGQGEAFPCIVCVGSNASKCHHEPSERILGPGQELLLDFGLVAGGYMSDMTRTIFFGRPSKPLEKIHRIVLEANLRSIDAVRSGRKCSRIDAVGRRIIDKAGYGRYFGHSLGHSLGLEIHEDPAFSIRDNSRLVPGMVMTVEPGIYLPGTGGVRIEDMVLVRDNDCEVLTSAPRSVIIE
jgi:Xaa-Pro aminopeptidase